jgi:recombination protein RecR
MSDQGTDTPGSAPQGGRGGPPAGVPARKHRPPKATGTGTRSAYPAAVERLVDEFAKLPGIGRRSAERLAFYVLKAEPAAAMAFAQAVRDVKETVRQCRVCFNLADGELCGVCADPRRDHATVLVVEQPKDLIALEQTGMFRGVYHVLMGHLSPLEGIGPSDLTVSNLLRRVEEPGSGPGGVPISEVVLGLNPTVEGDGTAMYLADELKRRGVRVTRLARGLPSGGQLEYANKAVLADAVQHRQAME